MDENLKVLFFEAEAWCTTCVNVKPILVKACEELNIDYDIIEVETERGEELSVKYKVRNVPLTVILKDGEEVERISGSRSSDQIRKELSKWK